MEFAGSLPAYPLALPIGVYHGPITNRREATYRDDRNRSTDMHWKQYVMMRLRICLPLPNQIAKAAEQPWKQPSLS